MIKKILALLLVSTAAVAGFYPVNRGMINQATVGTVAAGTTSFVATQNQVYIAEGSNIGQTFKFPNATSLPKDWWYHIINNSTGTVTASDNSNASITTLVAGGQGYFQLTDNSTAAGTWKYNSPASIGSIITDHGALTGLADDDHPQYLNVTRSDALYYRKTQHISTGAGAADAGKPIVLNGSGYVDATFLNAGLAITTIGSYDSIAPSADGATVSGSNILFQSATTAKPGMVNNSAQSFSGVKTFASPPVLSGLTVSRPAKIDAIGAVTSSAIDLASTEVTGLLGNANLANSSATVNGVVCTLGSSCSIPSPLPPTNIGTIDSQARSSDGLVTSSTTLYAQTATPAFPGLVSTSTQTFGGDKTFTGRVTASTVSASNTGTGAIPAFSVPVAGGSNAGFYQGASGATLTYNGADIASWIGSTWKFAVPLQMFITTNVTTPGMYWITDNTTGFYRSAANQWGFTSSGVQVANLGPQHLKVFGTVTASQTVNIMGVTASMPLKTDANKNVTSSQIVLSTDVVGLLPTANLADQSTTVNGTVCTLGGSCTVSAGSGGTPTSIGTIDSQARSADGLVTSSTVLYAQTATAAFPGLVSTSTQTFGGDKTFNGTVNLNTVTASRFLRSDGSKNVTSSLINLANSTNDITGTLAVGNGGLGITSTPSNGQIPIGNGTNYVAATITAGSGITVTNSAGGITINSTATSGTGLLGNAWGSEALTVTPSAGFGTTSGQTVKCRRVGDSIECSGIFTDGTVAGSQAYIDLPPQWTIDNTKVRSGDWLGQARSLGNGTGFNTYTSAGFAQDLFYDGTTVTRLYFGFAGGGGVFTKNNGNDLNQNGGAQAFRFSYPVVGWSAN